MVKPLNPFVSPEFSPGHENKITKSVEKNWTAVFSAQQGNNSVLCWLYRDSPAYTILCWLNPQVCFFHKIKQKILFSGLAAKTVRFDTADLRQNYELKHGCSVFFQNELLIFGVHNTSPSWSRAGMKKNRTERNCIYQLRENEKSAKIQCSIIPGLAWVLIFTADNRSQIIDRQKILAFVPKTIST